jgi:hypothetical protein
MGRGNPAVPRLDFFGPTPTPQSHSDMRARDALPDYLDPRFKT